MQCKKKSYTDKRFAVKALHRIQNSDDGRKKPCRAYLCDRCCRWHLTSKAINDDAAQEPYELKLNWENLNTMDEYQDIERELAEEAEHRKFEQRIAKKVKIAAGYNWNFSKFKRFVSQFLLTENDEDQWTHDYESWLLHIPEGRYEHPAQWARSYYNERWDKVKESESLQRINNAC